ncbi:MAG: hypothetical protein ACR2PM_13820 [Hyphomicrobiales bacterium]
MGWGLLKSLFAAVVLGGLLTAPAAARQGYNKLVLVGIEAVKPGKKIPFQKHDDVFVMTIVELQNGRSNQPIKFPGGNKTWKKMKAGTIRSVNETVWVGPVQNVRLYAQVRKMNHAKLHLTKGLFIGSGILGAAGITVLSGGAGAAVGAGIVGYAGGAVAAKVDKQASKFSVSLGQSNIKLELSRARDLVGKPTSRHRGLKYHFRTVHKANRGHYKLYWVIDHE